MTTAKFLVLASLCAAHITHAAIFEQRVLDLQNALIERGYNPGTPDGLWGKNTLKALQQFQRSKGMTVTFRYDEKSYRLLLANKAVVLETLEQRIKPPRGYVRVQEGAKSFGQWLRNQKLKASNAPVRLYNGQNKGNQSAHFAVFNIDIGTRDLQQCADAVMRLRAEYLFQNKKYNSISFNFTNGSKASYSEWRRGMRPVVSGNNVRWKQSASYDAGYGTFRKYLNTVFMYAGSYSLNKELSSASADSMAIGDVFIIGGFPGHAVIVVDMAVNPSTGKKVFMLAQSYMPAQDIHILINPGTGVKSPWYPTDFGRQLITPEWTFSRTDLKRFK